MRVLTSSWVVRVAVGFVLALGGMSLSTAMAQVELLLFGGRNNEVFLGCLSCSEYDSDSVHNRYGTFGSAYSSESIWNRYGQYGGSYGTYSPCNRYASDPPVVVDRDGGFYGYLTLSSAKSGRITDRAVLDWLENEVCS